MRNSVIIVAVMLGCLTHPETSVAQSIDKCMSARISDALQVCRNILESGSRNADVYWKLTSALYQDGQQAQANKTLDAALQLHPGNSKLLALKEIISSDSSEQELIARSAKLNQRSLDKGALKIACLTKPGEVAISACRRRLELTNDDGERMRTRLSELESEKAAATIAIAPVIPVTTQMPSPDLAPQPEPSVETRELESTVSDSELQAAEARSQAYKTLVADVQRQLNEFGFNTGLPDGVPGKKTRSALSEFYKAVDAPANSSITTLTLNDFDNERRKLTNAKQFLEQSYRALEQGNARLAEQKLTDARLASKLVKVPTRLEQAIRSELDTTLPGASATGSTTAPSLPPANERSSVPTQPSSSNSQQFGELMGQIKLLHGQIRRKEEEQALKLDRLRSIF